MKSIKSIRRASKVQIAKLTQGETKLILDTFAKRTGGVTSNVGTMHTKTAVLPAHMFEFVTMTQTPVLVQAADCGTSVRPEKAIIVNGAETVESFLARGGSIKTAKPCKIPAATVRVKGSRNMANTCMKAVRAVKSIETQESK